jgi:alcohol dehydrogenase (cytochrome c)
MRRMTAQHPSRRASDVVAATFAVLLSILGAACSEAQEPRSASSPAFSAAELAAPPRENWVTNGGNVFNQRHSRLDQINRDNVAELRAVRRFSLEGSGMGARNSGQGQPLVHEGVIYQVTGDNDVFAFDVDTGETLWRYRAELDPDEVFVCCGWTSRGLGMSEGKIFLGRLDAKLVALDQVTGEVVWEIQAEDNQDGFAITSAPLYYDGLVITGFAGGEYGIRGRVNAYDAATGDLVWTFYTIPGPGELGHDTWPQDSDAWMSGGAPVWQTPAVDPELGLIYFSTGNPGPDLNGAIRAGDNLFSVSIVALDVATGEHRWHCQQVHHDIWDYASPQPVILFDATIDGVPRKGLAEISKSGYLYILDRITGEPLIGIPETPVPQEPAQATAATQPIPVGDEIMQHAIDIAPEGFTLVNQGRTFTPFASETVLYAPLSGTNWPPSSYDPATNLMYICANDGIGGATMDEDLEGPPPSPAQYVGGSFARPNTAPARGIYAAVDLKTNRIAWRQTWAERCWNSSVTTAGGLVFLGRSDGRLTALDSATGMKLWEFQTDAGIHAAPSVFEHEGVQYLVAYAGGTIYARNKKGDGLWLFSLEGTLEPLPPGSGDPIPEVAAAPAAVAVPPGRLADTGHGREVYLQACLPCHGVDGAGGHNGAAPLTAALDVEGILTTVANGRNAMPAFGSVYSVEDIHDVAEYVRGELVAH